MKTDEEVYNKLVKEKCNGYRNTITVLAVVCVLLLCATIVFMCLYFGSGSIKKETNIDIVTDGGAIENANINSSGSTINGNIQIKDTSSITIAAVACISTVICVLGVVCLLRFTKK